MRKGTPVLKMSALLETDVDRNFLLSFKAETMERWVGRIGHRVDQIRAAK